MRLWTVHPKYLDSKGLVAAWREALLAQKVLAGRTRGYRFHPQLIRFRESASPRGSAAEFLRALRAEASARGYHFDARKITRHRAAGRIAETRGQLLHEWAHLRAKLLRRDPAAARRWKGVAVPDPHPLFRIVAGRRRSWEKA
ncbi:MAG TPA: pyrimidine dimer DNA glycosylase/endonuclease V [Opitutaceae bacterium]|jgi:hypothetical protein